MICINSILDVFEHKTLLRQVYKKSLQWWAKTCSHFLLSIDVRSYFNKSFSPSFSNSSYGGSPLVIKGDNACCSQFLS